jgi:hypothetical protein
MKHHHHREPETIAELAEVVRHRFRMALVAYAILAIAAIAGLVVSYLQEQTIRDNTAKLEKIAVCDAPRKFRQEFKVDATTCRQILRDYGHFQQGGP